MREQIELARALVCPHIRACFPSRSSLTVNFQLFKLSKASQKFMGQSLTIQFKSLLYKCYKQFKFELRKEITIMSNFMNDPSISGGRRVINYGAHGNVANQSLNQRLLDGIENLNNSNRFDNHFDQSQDDRLSSFRGDHNNLLSHLKRSETDLKHMPQVHFAADGDTDARNHPLHMKHSATVGGSGLKILERIDERKSQSPSMRSTKKGVSKQNLNDISNITINSKNLEDSVKAPNRPPVRIEGLTEFLVESHYKKFGVYSKVEPELFKYWKDYISLAYKEERKKKAQQNALYQSQISQDADAKQDSTGQPLFNSKGGEKRKEVYATSKGFILLEKFGSCYEMDVAYTLQQDFKDESKKQQTEREQLITSKKEARERYIKEQEDAMIKLSCELFFNDKIEFMVWCSQQKDLKDKTEDEKLKNWYKAVIDWKLQPINDATITKLTNSLSQNDQKADVKISEEENKKAEQLKKEKNLAKTEEEKKKNEETKALRESFRKEINKEQELIKNLFIYIRGKIASDEVIPNDATVAQRMYKDAKEKAQNGLIWPKGDNDAEVIIGRFFRAECLIRRLQILYEYKLEREGKYRHLSLFGFYIQISQRDRSLFLIDRKLVDAPLSFDAQAHNNSFKVILEKASDEAQKLHNPAIPQNQITRLMQEAIEDQIHTSLELKAVELTRTKLSETLSDNKQITLSVQEIINDYENNYKAELQIRNWIDQIKMKRKQKQVQEKTLEEVFGKEKKQKIDKQLKEQKTIERLGVLAKPKDKWKRLRILMELKKQFRHDITLQKMIKEELKSNRVFKFPEEYDLYDDQEDKLCKHQGEKSIKQYDNKLAQTLRDKFKEIDDQKLYYLKKEVASKRQEERQMENYLLNQALKYLEEKKKRLSGKTQTIREFVSKVYQEIQEKFKDLVKVRFPHITYGQDPNSATFKKSYPLTFKNYFFRLVKSYFRQQKAGVTRMKNPAPTFLISSGKAKCLMHINYACPDDCTYATFNKKIVLGTQRVKRLFKEPNSFRSRVWRRHDFKEALNKVLMLNSEKENCHFEPEAGSMSRTIDLALKANPNLRKDGFLSEPDPMAFVQKLGSNFDKSHPEVYKAGVLKRAQFMFREGKFDDALKRLYEGFNVESIRKRYEPQEMKKLIVQNLFKKKKEDSATRPVTGAQRIDGLKDEHESQKKRQEEDFENKKLLPILQEAYYLIKKIQSRKEDTQNKIKRIEKRQQSLRQQLKSFSSYKRSQSRSDYSEKIIYKTIMCPLKEKCPNDIRPRWPTSNTKSITKFGKECPFAHHPMELKFPESLITKMKASFQTIKNLNDKMDQEKPREAFKPAGKLFECSGCMEKSSMHLGGPCNMCRYKDMAKRSSEKFNNKQRKNSLMKKMARRESKEAKEDKKEMHEIMQELKLDDNYTKKFGLLKKSCVLFFYGRYGDAFEQIANAAEIIKNQREIEKHKQTVIERRWKFKLGMDEGFEFPMPLDQIDPHKVDEKFLKKLDLQGVSVSTLKLYIEQVAPQNQDEYSKHKFLNKCIEDFYLSCEAMLEDKTKTIAKMKKQVEFLDEMADQMDSLGAGGESSPERSPEKGGDMSERKYKPKKTKMCKEQVDKHRCSTQIQYRTQYNHIMKQYARSRSTKKEDIEKEQKELQTDLQKLRKCNLAHTPIDLDLIPVETKMKNLQGVIHSQTLKLKNMKPLEPWKPVKSGEIIHTHLMDMTSKGRKRKGSDGEDEEEEKRKVVKKKSIFDRENIHRKPFDVNE